MSISPESRARFALSEPDVYKRQLDDGGLAFFIQKRDERFARAKLENLVLCVERRVLAEGLRGGLNGLLLGRGVGAQSVLDAVRELREHLVGDIRR